MDTRSQWNGFKAIVYKEVQRVVRIWIQTILPPVITTSLYFLIFGNLIGHRIGEMENVPYSDFITPGLIMMSIITNSYGNVVSSFFGSKFQRNLEELLVSPLSEWIIVLGFISGGVIRAFFVGTIVFLVSCFFTDIEVAYPLYAVLFALGASLIFSLVGFVNAVFATDFDDTTIIPTFVLTPLIYLGGVFYSITLIPEFWQNLAYLNPILYMVNGLRYAMLGASDINPFFALAMVWFFIFTLFCFCVYLLKTGIGTRGE